MIYPEFYLNLSYNQKLVFAIVLIIAIGIAIIVTKMRNKALKISDNEIIPKKEENENMDVVLKDMKQEFIGQRKSLLQELQKMEEETLNNK